MTSPINDVIQAVTRAGVSRLPSDNKDLRRLIFTANVRRFDMFVCLQNSLTSKTFKLTSMLLKMQKWIVNTILHHY